MDDATRLRARLSHEDLTQGELASICCVHERTARKWVLGERPVPRYVWRLLEARDLLWHAWGQMDDELLARQEIGDAVRRWEGEG